MRHPKIDIYYALPVGRPTLALSFARREQAAVDRAVVKRTMDIVGAAAALLLLLPFMALVALAIAVESPGAPLYLQRRGGFQGESFTIYKFRTMRPSDDPGDAAQIDFEYERVTTGSVSPPDAHRRAAAADQRPEG
jgi:putative colanic acid biosynthesis UDP-glucose lipid carrier transferase